MTYNKVAAPCVYMSMSFLWNVFMVSIIIIIIRFIWLPPHDVSFKRTEITRMFDYLHSSVSWLPVPSSSLSHLSGKYAHSLFQQCFWQFPCLLFPTLASHRSRMSLLLSVCYVCPGKTCWVRWRVTKELGTISDLYPSPHLGSRHCWIILIHVPFGLRTSAPWLLPISAPSLHSLSLLVH